MYYHYDSFLGYRRGEDGQPEINEEQAAAVRRILSRYLMDQSVGQICRDLMSDGIKTARGGDKWYDNAVRGMLQNEKYIGDTILQKDFAADLFQGQNRVGQILREVRVQ